MPPMPNATTGPNTGSCIAPAITSTPPRTIGWITAGNPTVDVAAASSAGVRTSSTTPPLSVLCTPAPPAFTTTGNPSASAAASACEPVCVSRWAAVGMP